MNKYFVCIEFQTHNILTQKIGVGKMSSIVIEETIEQAIEKMKSKLPKNTTVAIITSAAFIEKSLEIVN